MADYFNNHLNSRCSKATGCPKGTFCHADPLFCEDRQRDLESLAAERENFYRLNDEKNMLSSLRLMRYRSDDADIGNDGYGLTEGYLQDFSQKVYFSRDFNQEKMPYSGLNDSASYSSEGYDSFKNYDSKGDYE